jgi:hypothetical protein
MMNPEMKKFTIPADAIRTEASIDIAAPPGHVIAVYQDVERWDEIYPTTIKCAQVVQTGVDWKEIVVVHKQEGRVPNTLFDLSETEIGLVEHKRKFDAWFVNRFLPAANGGTQTVISGYIRLKGIYRLFALLLDGYVRRQMGRRMRANVLEPLKTAAEKEVGCC